MEKVVSPSKFFTTIFYFNSFELGKVTLGAVKVEVIRMEIESV
jgi:hypothetical protein